MNRTTLAFLGILAAGPAAAQDGTWTFAASLYAWLPAISTSIETDVGTIEGDVSASDAISDLEFAFMGAFTAERDRWSLIGDLIYTDISTSSSTPAGLLFTKGTVDTEMTVFSGYAAYRVAETEQASLDLMGGFRLFSVDLGVTLQGDLAETRRFGGSETWVLPLVGARAIFPFADRWTATLFADVGGVSSDELTWQALASVGYEFRENWSAVVPYRYMDIQKPIGGDDAEIELYGRSSA